ncbi:Unannotated [Lentimonas sp. CC4]|nr:Unannotated [Lentimonas sp. CC4]CAA6686064.1 Unannotated [Lentimonas sp. CC6]CAA7077705.1 Unannotated [Lentimonas sp. CC4]CAA7168514.1 Unannotated [Lentimonas sp. CC21]CAA7182991.1 Unannotated [Lentimonas sp. CC8]
MQEYAYTPLPLSDGYYRILDKLMRLIQYPNKLLPYDFFTLFIMRMHSLRPALIPSIIILAVSLVHAANGETVVKFEGFTSGDGESNNLMVNGSGDHQKVVRSVELVDDEDQFTYKVTYSGADYNGDSRQDTLSFDLKAIGYWKGETSTSEELKEETSAHIGSVKLGRSKSVLQPKRGGRDTFTVAGNMSVGDSLQFSVENVSVNIDGYSAVFNGFSGFQIRETGSSYGHMVVVGVGGPNLLTLRTNETLDVDFGLDVHKTLTVSAADGIGSNPQRWGVQNLEFDITVSDKKYVDIPEPASYGLLLSLSALCVTMCRRPRMTRGIDRV